MPDTTAAHIMVVDDDPEIRAILRECFALEGYGVSEAADGTEMRAALNAAPVDLITLDLNLRGEDGLTLAREIRAHSDIPIIMVTGKGDMVDRVVGLEIGADDYITKPFHLREVLARVRSVLRRSTGARNMTPVQEAAAQQAAVATGSTALSGADAQSAAQSNAAAHRPPAAAAPDTGSQPLPPAPLPPDPSSLSPSSLSQVPPHERYSFENWTLDVTSRELIDPDGKPCPLTTAEFNLLLLFVKRPHCALSRDVIMDGLKGHDWSPLDRSIDTLVGRLRKKIDPASAPAAGSARLVKTVRGVGYMFAADVVRR